VSSDGGDRVFGDGIISDDSDGVLYLSLLATRKAKFRASHGFLSKNVVL